MSAESTPPAAGFLRRRLIDPILAELRKGLSPTKLALTVALGAAFGMVPLLGLTTVLGTAIALWLRLNVGAMLLVSHAISPLQLLLFVPLLRLGAAMFGGANASQLTFSRFQHLISHDWVAALQLFWRAELGALLLWLAGSVPVVVILYYVLLPVFRRIAARQAAANEPAA